MIPIQFSHSNGFPAKTYQHFFNLLAPHPVSYINILGENKDKITSWQPYIDELISDIESRYDAPIIGLGHSFGGALTFKAAHLRPDLFKKIIILDPPIFGKFKRTMIPLFNALSLTEKMVPIVKKAANRRTHFSSREEAFDYWKDKSFFKKFHPAAFQAYVDEGLVESSGGGFELAIPARREVSIFKLPVNVSYRPFQMPAYYIYATQNGVLTPAEWKEHKRRLPDMELIPWDGQHMFPLEEPQKTADFVKEIIAR